MHPTTDVYDVIIDKEMPTSVLIPANQQRNIMKSASDNIVPQNEQKITIEDMLRGVLDPDKKPKKNQPQTVHLYNIYENKKSSRFVSKDRLNNSTREDNNNISQTNNKINFQSMTQVRRVRCFAPN